MRQITSEEYAFLCRVARETGVDLHAIGLSAGVMVAPLPDGDMGSIGFCNAEASSERRFGSILIQGLFDDADGVPVSFAIYLDKAGIIYELDMWKVDFSTFQRFPSEASPITYEKFPTDSAANVRCPKTSS